MNRIQKLKRMQSNARQSGFTIIELVVVILLLGILAATALPRFMDVTDEAHAAVVRGVAGGLSTGSGLFHAQWVGNSQPGGVAALANFGDGTAQHNGKGYPGGGKTEAEDQDLSSCNTIFTGLLQGGRPSTNASTGTITGIPVTDGTNDYSDDFLVGASGVSCYYVYTAAGSTVSAPYITLNAQTGSVEFDAALLVSPFN